MAAQREWFEKDYYRVLGVAETATAKEITKAYRKLAHSHPDTHPGDGGGRGPLQGGQRRMTCSATRPSARSTTRSVARSRRRLRSRRPGGGPGGTTFNVGADGLGDLLGQMFGRGRRGGAPAAGGPQRRADVEATLTLDFADAVRGLTTTLYLTTDAQCGTCNGSGAKPGTSPKVLALRRGGVVDDNQGFFSFSSPCQACAGRGSPSSRRAPPVVAPASRSASARCRRIPAGWPTARRSG